MNNNYDVIQLINSKSKNLKEIFTMNDNRLVITKEIMI